MLYLYILSDKNTEIQRMYIGCIKSNISQNKASYKNIFVSQWWMSQNLKLWVWTLFRRGVLKTSLWDQVCQWLATSQWFSPGTLVSFTNKTDCHDITENIVESGIKHH
jgi:hypothetical protein